MSINEKWKAALRALGTPPEEYVPGVGEWPAPPAANAVDAVTLNHIRQAQQMLTRHLPAMRPGDMEGMLYGVSTKDWPGLIQGWLMAASDEDLATIRKSELPFKVIEFYMNKGLAEEDMQAMAKLQSPGGAATLLFEAIMMEFHPQMELERRSSHAPDMAVYGRQVYRGMLRNDPYFGPKPKKLP